MKVDLGLAVMLGWILVTALLSRALGLRRATLISVIGGQLVVPCMRFDMARGAMLGFTQLTAIGLAVAVGVLVGDPRAVLRMRPAWLDLPMLAYVAYPLTGLITNGPSAAWGVGDMILERGLGTLVPYAAARRYLGDVEGARQVGIAIVVATLLFVPVVAFEAIMGPRWYLQGLIYGAKPNLGFASRLGGWRPEGFFLNGLALATWMALAAVVASWLWLWRGWRPPRGPSWWPALVLVLASVGCRGVYGYITLGLGLAAAAISRATRSRLAIALLLLAAPVYIGLRMSGAWDARALTRMAALTGRPSTVEFRLLAEDEIIEQVLGRRPIVGFGVHILHRQLVGETIGHWPDGQWLFVLWSGGLAGLALHLSAFSLVPAGLALAEARPRDRRGPADAGSPVLGLALFTTLVMLDGLHNQWVFPPRALVAGSLVGIAAGRRRRIAAPREASRPAREREAPSRPRPSVETSLIPMVTAMACLLFVFENGPVAGHEVAKLIGGLGAALLFAAAGGVGAWASSLVPLPRLALFAGLFAALGISCNLALHHGSRPLATADILQGLALCSLAVACWRRWVGAHAWGDAALVALPLLAHFLLRPFVPGFPGVQYLFDIPAGAPSLFPLFPWLTMAALGAWTIGESAAVSGAAASLLAAATALAWWSGPGSSGPVKSPMNLPYALLSCAAIEAAFTLAHALRRPGAAARAAAWLGRNWLIYFYLHLAVASVLGRSGIGPAVAVWAMLAAGSLGASWLVAKAAAPFSDVFRSPVAWTVPVALTAAAGGWPGLPPAAVAGLAGLAGLIFAAYHGMLAYLVVNLPSLVPWPFNVSSRSRSSPGAASSRRTGPSEPGRGHERERGRSEPPDAVGSGPGRGLIRLAVLVALLAVPEAVGSLGPPQPVPPTRRDPPPRPGPEATPSLPPGGETGGPPSRRGEEG